MKLIYLIGVLVDKASNVLGYRFYLSHLDEIREYSVTTAYMFLMNITNTAEYKLVGGTLYSNTRMGLMPSISFSELRRNSDNCITPIFGRSYFGLNAWSSGKVLKTGNDYHLLRKKTNGVYSADTLSIWVIEVITDIRTQKKKYKIVRSDRMSSEIVPEQDLLNILNNPDVIVWNEVIGETRLEAFSENTCNYTIEGANNVADDLPFEAYNVTPVRDLIVAIPQQINSLDTSNKFNLFRSNIRYDIYSYYSVVEDIMFDKESLKPTAFAYVSSGEGRLNPFEGIQETDQIALGYITYSTSGNKGCLSTLVSDGIIAPHFNSNDSLLVSVYMHKGIPLFVGMCDRVNWENGSRKLSILEPMSLKMLEPKFRQYILDIIVKNRGFAIFNLTLKEENNG